MVPPVAGSCRLYDQGEDFADTRNGTPAIEGVGIVRFGSAGDVERPNVADSWQNVLNSYITPRKGRILKRHD